MVANNIEVIAVVIMSFLMIFGFIGAPGSVPFTMLSWSLYELISLGKIIKNINHHNITKTTNDPVNDITI